MKSIEITADKVGDPKFIHDLCMRHEEYPHMLFGENTDGEKVHVSVNEDNLTVETFQHNGWLRTNIYYDDMYGTSEELYERLHR